MFLVSLQAALPCQTLVWWLHNVHREPSQTDGQATSSFFWDIAWLWPLNVVPIPCSKISLAVCSDHRNWHIVKYGQTPCCWKFFELKMYWTDAGLQGLHYSYHFLNWKCIGQMLAYRDFITAIIFWIGNVLDRRWLTGTSLQLSFFELEMYWTDAGLLGLHYSYHFLNWKCIGRTLAYWDFITAIIYTKFSWHN